MRQPTYIIDTSALLSGKPINIFNAPVITAPGVSSELHHGGRDYRSFQLLRERGLSIHEPSQASLDACRTAAEKSGDISRVSATDLEVLALGLDVNADPEREAIILTDDYSIQNLASILSIKFIGLSQDGITRRIQWEVYCPGCGRHFPTRMQICTICGTKTRVAPKRREPLP